MVHHFELKPSQIQITWVCFAHGTMSWAVWLLQLDLSLKCGLIIVILARLWRVWQRLKRHQWLVLDESGQSWLAVTDDPRALNCAQEITLCGPHLVLVEIILLRYRYIDASASKTLLIFYDSADLDSLRKLRVLLRFRSPSEN